MVGFEAQFNHLGRVPRRGANRPAALNKPCAGRTRARTQPLRRDAAYFSPYWHPPRGTPGRSAFEWIGPFNGACDSHARLPADERAVAARLWAKCERLCDLRT